jgi:N6-L-threonylcarbamoyladenine synthase
VVGSAVGTMLAEYFEKPFVPVNHIHGHIFSILLERKVSDIEFPMVILTASGGHNDIYLVTATQTQSGRTNSTPLHSPQ